MKQLVEKAIDSKPLVFAIVLLVLGLFRLVPHPPNLTPVVAIAMLATVWFKRPLMRAGIPILIMLVTDTFIGFHELAPVIYLSMIIAGLFGHMIKKEASLKNAAIASVSASIVFFTLSNFGVWVTSGMYPKTMMGLLTCYQMAIPFFHNTVTGTAGLVLGGMFVSNRLEHNFKTATTRCDLI